MLVIALLVFAAKAPSPPPAHCEDGHLVVRPAYGDIVIGAQDIVLRDSKPAQKSSKTAQAPREKTLSIAVNETRTFAIDASGWTLKEGNDVKVLTNPKGTKSSEVRSLGVSGMNAWIAGPTWIAHVDLETGDVVSSRLTRDSRAAVVLDVADTLLLQSGDRVYRCSATDAVCAEAVRLPFTPARTVIGPSGFLFASDNTTDKVVRVMRDKIDTVIAVNGGPSAVFCSLGSGLGALYVPTPVWQVTWVSTEPGDVPQWMARDRLLARALMTDATAGSTKAVFDTALREKWPELEGLGLVATNDARPEVRAVVAQAFASVPSTRGFATLWLLGRDSDPSVRSAALDATARWCSKQRVVPCTSALKHYTSDASGDVAWLARDLLLAYDPLAALRDAPADYRRDAVSRLTTLLLTSSNPALREALLLLTYDTDQGVRTAARQTLSGMGL